MLHALLMLALNAMLDSSSTTTPVLLVELDVLNALPPPPVPLVPPDISELEPVPPAHLDVLNVPMPPLALLVDTDTLWPPPETPVLPRKDALKELMPKNAKPVLLDTDSSLMDHALPVLEMPKLALELEPIRLSENVTQDSSRPPLFLEIPQSKKHAKLSPAKFA